MRVSSWSIELKLNISTSRPGAFRRTYRYTSSSGSRNAGSK